MCICRRVALKPALIGWRPDGMFWLGSIKCVSIRSLSSCGSRQIRHEQLQLNTSSVPNPRSFTAAYCLHRQHFLNEMQLILIAWEATPLKSCNVHKRVIYSLNHSLFRYADVNFIVKVHYCVKLLVNLKGVIEFPSYYS